MYLIVLGFVIGLSLVLWYYNQIKSVNDFWTFIKCLANIYGLSLIMVLLSYGILEIP